jgi:hypothetical protein
VKPDKSESGGATVIGGRDDEHLLDRLR